MSFDPFHSVQLEKILNELNKIEGEESKYDRAIIAMLLELHHNSDETLKIQREINHKFSKLLDLLTDIVYPYPKAIASFNIVKQGEKPMSVTQGPLTGIVPGASAQLSAVPFDGNNNQQTDTTVISQVTLVWTSSDPANFPVSSSGTAGDFNATVGPVPAGVDPTATATISVAQAAPLADGSNATGSAVETVIPTTPPPPPVLQIAQFVIVQGS